jgi:hypothetical protein
VAAAAAAAAIGWAWDAPTDASWIEEANSAKIEARLKVYLYNII